MGQICGKEKKFTPKKEVPERTNEKEEVRITSIVNENVGEEVRGALETSEEKVKKDENNTVSSSAPEQLKDKDKENDVNKEEQVEENILMKEVPERTDGRLGSGSDDPVEIVTNPVENLRETDPSKPDTEESFAKSEELPKTPRNSAVASSEAQETAEDNAGFQNFSDQVIQNIRDNYDNVDDTKTADMSEEAKTAEPETEATEDTHDNDEEGTGDLPDPKVVPSEAAKTDNTDFEDFSAQIFQGIKEKYDNTEDDVANDVDIQNSKEKKAETETEDDDDFETPISTVPSIIVSEPSIDQSAFEDFSAQLFQGLKDKYDGDEGEEMDENDDKIVTSFTVVEKDQNTEQDELPKDKKDIMDDDLEKSFTVVEDSPAGARKDEK